MRALITGAATRLGRDMALYLAGRGYDVAVHYGSSETAAHQTVRDIKSTGRDAIALQADLLDEMQCETLVDRAVHGLNGPLNLLVNSASVFEYDTLQSATRENWDRHMGSNLRAPFVLIQKFAVQAVDAQEDENGELVCQNLIVNMVDQRLRKLTPEFMTYTLAKYGLWGLTQTAAQALAPHVRVNAIGPGPTVQGIRQSDSHFARQRAATVLERGSDPADICAALGYFCDAKAVTGQLLCVDGGQHLVWQTKDILGVE